MDGKFGHQILDIYNKNQTQTSKERTKKVHWPSEAFPQTGGARGKEKKKKPTIFSQPLYLTK